MEEYLDLINEIIINTEDILSNPNILNILFDDNNELNILVDYRMIPTLENYSNNLKLRSLKNITIPTLTFASLNILLSLKFNDFDSQTIIRIINLFLVSTILESIFYFQESKLLNSNFDELNILINNAKSEIIHLLENPTTATKEILKCLLEEFIEQVKLLKEEYTNINKLKRFKTMI